MPRQPAERRGSSPHRGGPLLQRRRRHQPRGRARRSCLFTRVSPVGLEAIADAPRGQLPGCPGARAAVARPRRPRAAARGDRGRPEPWSSRRTATALEGCLGAARRAAPLARLLRRPGGRRAGRAGRPLRPRQRDPGLAEQMEASARPADRSRPPAGSRGLRRRLRRPPDPPLRPRPGELAMRPVNLIPPEERRGERTADAHRPARLHRRRRPCSRPCVGGDPAGRHRQPDLRPQGRSRPARSGRGRAAPKRRPRGSPPTPSSTRSANSGSRPSPASPTAASTGSG